MNVPTQRTIRSGATSTHRAPPPASPAVPPPASPAAPVSSPRARLPAPASSPRAPPVAPVSPPRAPAAARVPPVSLDSVVPLTSSGSSPAIDPLLLVMDRLPCLPPGLRIPVENPHQVGLWPPERRKAYRITN